MSVGLAAGAGVGGVTSCAKATVVAAEKAAINRTTDDATCFVEVKAFIAVDSTGERPERQSQRRKTSARAVDCVNGTANRQHRRYHGLWPLMRPPVIRRAWKSPSTSPRTLLTSGSRRA